MPCVGSRRAGVYIAFVLIFLPRPSRPAIPVQLHAMSSFFNSIKSASDLVHLSSEPLPVAPDGLTDAEAASSSSNAPPDHGFVYKVIDDVQSAFQRGDPIELDEQTLVRQSSRCNEVHSLTYSDLLPGACSTPSRTPSEMPMVLVLMTDTCLYVACASFNGAPIRISLTPYLVSGIRLSMALVGEAVHFGRKASSGLGGAIQIGECHGRVSYVKDALVNPYLVVLIRNRKCGTICRILLRHISGRNMRIVLRMDPSIISTHQISGRRVCHMLEAFSLRIQSLVSHQTGHILRPH